MGRCVLDQAMSCSRQAAIAAAPSATFAFACSPMLAVVLLLALVSVEAYDPQQNRWEAVADMGCAHELGALASLGLAQIQIQTRPISSAGKGARLRIV